MSAHDNPRYDNAGNVFIEAVGRAIHRAREAGCYRQPMAMEQLVAQMDMAIAIAVEEALEPDPPTEPPHDWQTCPTCQYLYWHSGEYCEKHYQREPVHPTDSGEAS